VDGPHLSDNTGVFITIKELESGPQSSEYMTYFYVMHFDLVNNRNMICWGLYESGIDDLERREVDWKEGER